MNILISRLSNYFEEMFKLFCYAFFSFQLYSLFFPYDHKRLFIWKLDGDDNNVIFVLCCFIVITIA